MPKRLDGAGQRGGEATRGGSIQAVEFALEILEYVARCQTSVGVSELARAFGTTKSRIHRHLQTLVAAGYLIRNDETERYAISARLMALGQAVSESFESPMRRATSRANCATDSAMRWRSASPSRKATAYCSSCRAGPTSTSTSSRARS